MSEISIPSPLKKSTMTKKLAKLIKQQQNTSHKGLIIPGKVNINASKRCKPRVVNFFGDVNTQIFCLHTSEDEQYVAAGCQNGDVRIYHIYQGNLLLLQNSSRLQGYPNTGIRWRPKSNTQITACNSDGTIKWYDRKLEKMIAHHQSDIGYLCTDYNCNGDWSVYGNKKYFLEIFDSQKKKLIQKYDAGSVQQWNPNHMNSIFCVRHIKKQPNLFFSGGWDSTVRLWDIRIPNSFTRKFYGPSITSQSLDLKNNILLVGNYSNKDIIQLWDFNSGKLIENINLQESHIGGAYCLCASYAHQSQYNLFAVGLTSLNKIKIFQQNLYVAQIQFQSTPLALNFYRSHHKDFIVAGGAEGTIYAIKVQIVQESK